MPQEDQVSRIPMRRLGAGGPEVGAVGLGCMGMSWAYGASERDDAASEDVIRHALELGVTLIDTADMYGPFHNEELVGRAIAGRRDEVVLATKVGLVVEDAATYTLGRNGRPEHVRRAAHDSVRRLGVDVVDLLYLHRVDPDVPLAETWGAMAALVAAGTVRMLGLSEVSPAEIEIADAVHPVAAVQSELSLWTRDRLEDVLPWCARNGAAFVPYAPLGRGYLTGTVGSETFGADDFRARNPRFSPEAMDRNRVIVERVRAVAGRVGATPAQVALAWTLAQGEHVVPIPGTKQRRYLEENAAAATVTLAPADLAELDGAPAAVGARY